MMLDLALAVRATGAHLLRCGTDGQVVQDDLHAADLRRRFRCVTIDSRQIEADDLFVALRGERTDGHAHLDAALASGAAGCLVSESADQTAMAASLLESRSDAVMLVVSDPLTALQQLARHWRDTMPAEVIGITGSIGKTTTKEIVAGVLAQAWSVLRSEANLNTEIGLPLMLLRLRPHHRAAVLEMGMYVPGDIALLAGIARPRIGIVTNVAPVHLERAGTIERIARAKSELVASLPPDGLAVLNGDDPWTRAMARTSGVARTVLYGESAACDLRAVDIASHGLDGMSFTIAAEAIRLAVRTQVAGKHTIGAFLAAAAVARELGLSWDAIAAALPSVRLDARQRVTTLGDRLTIIDDSYNSAPLSVAAALDLLHSVPAERIAVLGDMLELGPEEAAAHRQVGVTAAGTADWLVTRGTRATWIAEGARQAGLDTERIVETESNADAANAVRDIMSNRSASRFRASAGRDEAPASRLQASDSSSHSAGPAMQRPGGRLKSARRSDSRETRWAVLVKGSRGMGMEEIVGLLRGAS